MRENAKTSESSRLGHFHISVRLGKKIATAHMIQLLNASIREQSLVSLQG